MAVNKLLIGAGAAITAFALFGFKKLKDYTTVFESIEVMPHDIANIGLQSWNVSKFDLKLRIINNTSIPVDLDTLGLITITRVFIYSTTGNLITQVVVNETSLRIPSHGYAVTKWLPMTVPILNIIEAASTGLDPYKLGYKVEINIKGAGTYLLG